MSFNIQAQNYTDYWLSDDIAQNVSLELDWAMHRQSSTNSFNLTYLLELDKMFKQWRRNSKSIQEERTYWRKKNDELVAYFTTMAEVEEAATSYSGMGQSFYDAKKYYLAAQCFNSYLELTKNLPKEGNLPGQIVSAQYLVSLSLYRAGKADAALTFLLMNDTKANLYKIPDYELRKSASDMISKIEDKDE